MNTNFQKNNSDKKSVNLLQDIRLVIEKARTLGLTDSHIIDPDAKEPTFHWNALRDTRYAHRGHGLDDVLHIFQQQWFGIRAAAGSLPGYKLAVGPEGALDHASKRALARKIQQLKPQRIVIHGMSEALGDLVEMLAAMGLSKKLFLVIHGAPAQWCSPLEARYAFRAFDFGRSGKIRRLHVMKPGFELPNVPLYKPMLFNISPNLLHMSDFAEKISPSRGGIVFIPGWGTWTKNIHTSALAAAISECVRSVIVFDPNFGLPSFVNKKINRMIFKDREQTFNLILSSDVMMNVSMTDCHPMVNVEAQVLGRACLRRPLFLDALEEHPYVELTQVSDVTSVNEIRMTLERVLAVPLAERRDLALDYQSQSDRISIGRYQEFLEL